MEIIAHRVTDIMEGKKALDFGVDFVEIDVAKQFLFPRFVVRHNGVMGKLGTGPLLASIFMPSIQRKLFLDLKHTNISRNFAKKLSTLLKTLKVKNVRVCGLEWKVVSEVCKDNGLLPFYSIYTSRQLKKIEKSLLRLEKPAGFSVYFPLINKVLIEKLKKHGEVWAWTVNDPQIAKDLVKMGVSGIITDNWKEITKAFKRG